MRREESSNMSSNKYVNILKITNKNKESYYLKYATDYQIKDVTFIDYSANTYLSEYCLMFIAYAYDDDKSINEHIYITMRDAEFMSQISDIALCSSCRMHKKYVFATRNQSFESNYVRI